jgi:uncharacterized protein (DUF433 family)
MQLSSVDTGHLSLELGRGCYDTRRAAALAGVPMRTLHYWAQRGLYRPSISPEPRVRLWSWFDLLALRAIDWLRQGDEDRAKVSVQRVRQALEELDFRQIPRSRLHSFLWVSRSGELFIEQDDVVFRAAPGRQTLMPDTLNPIQPYNDAPDLLEPRPRLRIIPGKLLGEPHIVDTRIPSAAIFTLHRQGYSTQDILAFYPDVTNDDIADAIDLERALNERVA